MFDHPHVDAVTLHDRPLVDATARSTDVEAPKGRARKTGEQQWGATDA